MRNILRNWQFRLIFLSLSWWIGDILLSMQMCRWSGPALLAVPENHFSLLELGYGCGHGQGEKEGPSCPEIKTSHIKGSGFPRGRSWSCHVPRLAGSCSCHHPSPPAPSGMRHPRGCSCIRGCGRASRGFSRSSPGTPHPSPQGEEKELRPGASLFHGSRELGCGSSCLDPERASSQNRGHVSL